MVNFSLKPALKKRKKEKCLCSYQKKKQNKNTAIQKHKASRSLSDPRRTFAVSAAAKALKPSSSSSVQSGNSNLFLKKKNPHLAQRKINEVGKREKKKGRNILKAAVSLVDETQKEKTVM